MNKLSEAAKFLLMAGSILITCALIATGFIVYAEGEDTIKIVTEQINDHNKDLKNSDILKYDGLKVSGSDVINVIKKYLGNYSSPETGPFTIKVITSKRTTSHINKDFISYINNFSSDYYIKPTANFMGSVTMNANGVIIELKFQQQ